MVTKKHFNQNGSITIFLSISLSIIITLIFYTLESCHIDSLVARSEGITYLSLDSLFGQYCLPLFEDYGLFCLNKQGLNLENEVKKYADYNTRTPASILHDTSSFLSLTVKDVKIKDVSYITDDDAKEFVKQVCDYVKYMELSAFADTLKDNSNSERPEVFTTNKEGTLEINFNSIDMDKANELRKYDSKDNESSQEEDSDSNNSDSNSNNPPGDFKDNASKYIEHIIKNGLLSFLVDKPENVSTLTTDKAVLPSVTCQLTEEGVAANLGYTKDIAKTSSDKAYFCEYIYNTFGCYLEPENQSYLKYPIEYIIHGSNEDDVNFINCCSHIINFRLACNLVYLFSDKEKYNDAKKAAEVANYIPFPGAEYLTRITILAIWATAEALLDTKDLLSNKKVPLIKNDKTWTLELSDLTTFSKSTISKNDGKSGLSYKRYLELLLATENNISLYYRTLDVIQMNICSKYNDDFRISNCVYSLDVDISYSLPYIFSRKKITYKSTGHHRYR